mgnify:CR=1 FL=1|tara:strand:+ start:173 stop:1219 length:1047 start_codon:yes stop_codon:yes gene_type:complete
MSYFRSLIDALDGYEPGEQPQDKETIKLNTNENPYPPSPLAIAALKDFDGKKLRRYPRPLADEFRVSVGSVLNIDPTWILVGNGSDDLLNVLFRSVGDTDRSIAFPKPTYSLYQSLAQLQNAPVIPIPFDESYELPVEELIKAKAALTIIASPNSPSGNRISNEAIGRVAANTSGLIVVDEAYAAFASSNALSLINQFTNIVIVRTLSKSHSLAGLRLGFAVAQPKVISGLSKVKDSYNVDSVSSRVGSVAIQDTAYTEKIVRDICNARDELSAALTNIGFLVWPSEANFLLVRPPHENAKTIYTTLKQQGILVRYFDEEMLRDKLRITVGTSEENQKLLDRLEQFKS